MRFRECGGAYDDSLEQTFLLVVQDVRQCTGSWAAPTVTPNTGQGFSVDSTNSWIAYSVDEADLVVTWASADNGKC